MEEIKEPFYKKVIASIKDFDRYQDFAMQSTNNGIKYFLKLVLVMSFIVSLAYTIKIAYTTNESIKYIKNNMPYFKYENDILSVDSEQAIIYEKSDKLDVIIIIDTNDVTEEELEEYKKRFALYNNGILFLKDKVTMKNQLVSEEVTQSYKEILDKYNIQSFDKDELIETFSGSRVISIVISFFISLFIAFVITYILQLLMEAVIPMIFGYITGRMIGLKLKLQNVFNITIHAMTLSVILEIIYIVVNLATGFYIKYFDIMYITIINIYIITALFIIRSNLIKQQIELMKIVEEQKKVKEEIIEKEKEQQEKEKKESQEEQKDNKEEKKEEKDNNIGKEVNGEV